MRLVLDASAAVRVVMRAEDASEILATLAAAAVVTAPSLFASEVANALWKYTRAGALSVETALRRYEEAIGLVGELTPDGELATEALAEAARHGHPVYDLLYAILARRHGCSVLTQDERLASLLGLLAIPMAPIPPPARPEAQGLGSDQTPRGPRGA